MYGDKLLVYNAKLGMFYGGVDDERKGDDGETPVIWVRDIERAVRTRNLGYMHRLVDRLGDGAQVMSETRARREVMLRDYREGKDRG